MLFNSIEFAIFLPIIFLLHWLVFNGQLKHQNALLLLASYYFYSCWDFRFLFLLLFSTLLDYYSGIRIEQSNTIKVKKLWFRLSILINLGLLGVFKYYNFFIDSFAEALTPLGLKINPSSLNIILPVGISFYTFHGLSYIIDIYKNRINAEKKFANYALFVSFFPLLVAGPIERATHLLPQLKRSRSFNYKHAVNGMRQILWGLFKKIVIADNCAEIANLAFNHPQDQNGVTLVLAAIFFAFQIYGDFSGYSDIAIGTARLFEIELLKNFSFPYFSQDIAEFWRRWHISLTTWFRDYLYIPLGGSRGNKWQKIRNTLIVFTLSGLWHGANWTFIFWGLLNALFFLPLLLNDSNKKHHETVAKGKLFPGLRASFNIIFTFTFTTFAWIFFRAESMHHAIVYLKKIFEQPNAYLMTNNYFKYSETLIPVFVFIVVEWLGRESAYAIADINKLFNPIGRMVIYLLIIFSLFWFSGSPQQFIYFQF